MNPTYAPNPTAVNTDPLAKLRDMPPQVHPRDVACQKAAQDLNQFLIAWQEKHGLAEVETLHILNTLAHRRSALAVMKERADKETQ